VHIELAVDAIHAPGINEDQHDKYVDRTLLCEPETELKATNTDVVHLLYKEYAEAKGAGEPDCEADRDEPQVGAPVSHTILRMHCAPGNVRYRGEMPDTKKTAPCEAAF